jgi:hypothetical protein
MCDSTAPGWARPVAPSRSLPVAVLIRCLNLVWFDLAPEGRQTEHGLSPLRG